MARRLAAMSDARSADVKDSCWENPMGPQTDDRWADGSAHSSARSEAGQKDPRSETRSEPTMDLKTAQC